MYAIPPVTGSTQRCLDKLDDLHAALSYDPARDATSWFESCRAAHINEGSSFRQRAATIAARWSALEILATARGWPERTVVAMEHALTGELTRAPCAGELAIPVATASSDLRRLVDAGFLEQVGKGRSTSYVASASLRAVVSS